MDKKFEKGASAASGLAREISRMLPPDEEAVVIVMRKNQVEFVSGDNVVAMEELPDGFSIEYCSSPKKVAVEHVAESDAQINGPGVFIKTPRNRYCSMICEKGVLKIEPCDLHMKVYT